MNAELIIKAVGGRKAVMEMTDLTKGRISQMVTEGHIPDHWMKLFEAKFPDLDWPYLRGEAAPRKAVVATHRRRSTDKKDPRP